MRCDRLHATISVAQCLANQNRTTYSHPSRSWMPSCWDCPTGELAREGKLTDADVESLKRDLMDKQVDQQQERIEMEQAQAKTDNQSPVGPPAGRPVQAQADLAEETPARHTCYRCGFECDLKDAAEYFYRDRALRDGFKSKCKKCSSETSKAAWARKREEAEKVRKVYQRPDKVSVVELPDSVGRKSMPASAPPPKQERAVRPEAEAALHRSPAPVVNCVAPPAKETCDATLTVDFQDYPELLRKIKDFAKNEDRTPEAQVRYWLRMGMAILRDDIPLVPPSKGDFEDIKTEGNAA